MRWISGPLLLVLLLASAACVNALYFVLEGNQPKCFIEELPKETTVIGTFSSASWSDRGEKYEENAKLSILIHVDHTETQHRLVSQTGQAKGRFTFTSSDAGEHKICISAENSGGWFGSPKTKLTLDLMFGDVTHDVTSSKKVAANDLAQTVRDIKERAIAILKEQQYQRAREAEFRDTSEATNSKVVQWTIIQVIVLVITGLWQVRHLKQFFVSKKLL
ncbi:emp24/gp25L/p24 family/GOLD-domain-containing protein [Zopfochytrium polystomum]|nr:emp24/gp25L/p24 family/GOLD-domain-containing protein [Zopfochytrium polystomum]